MREEEEEEEEDVLIIRWVGIDDDMECVWICVVGDGFYFVGSVYIGVVFVVFMCYYFLLN